MAVIYDTVPVRASTGDNQINSNHHSTKSNSFLSLVTLSQYTIIPSNSPQILLSIYCSKMSFCAPKARSAYTWRTFRVTYHCSTPYQYYIQDRNNHRQHYSRSVLEVSASIAAVMESRLTMPSYHLLSSRDTLASIVLARHRRLRFRNWRMGYCIGDFAPEALHIDVRVTASIGDPEPGACAALRRTGRESSWHFVGG